MKRFVAIVTIGALHACCGQSQKVNSFDVQQRTACPGSNVVVSWDVTGTAKLAILPRPSGAFEPEPTPDEITAAEKAVDSKHSEPFAVNETTWFVIRAVDAKQAKEPWLGKQHVDVPVKDEPRGHESTCDGSICRATFTVHADHDTARVLRIYEPKAKQGGKARDATIFITHASFDNERLEPGKTIDVPVPLEGEWTLQTTLAAGVPSTPPPGLSVMLHIGCP
ncbi:MAG: hypothetical protein JWO36_3362 [Myxococcales bacterium]|nr:hypothetical protein [Myxococcales bacterium]